MQKSHLVNQVAFLFIRKTLIKLWFEDTPRIYMFNWVHDTTPLYLHILIHSQCASF